MEPAREPTGRVCFYPPRWRLLALAAGCLVLATAGYLPTRAASPVLVAVGWVTVGLLGSAALVLLVRAVRPGPTVVVDEYGLTDRTTLAPAGLVTWDEIEAVRKREIGRGLGTERLLEFLLCESAGFHARPRGRWRRLVERYRRALNQPVVSVPASMVSVPLPVVMAAVRQHRPELHLLEGPPPAPSTLAGFRSARAHRRHPEPPRW